MSLLTIPRLLSSFFFFFNDTATTEIYTLSLHDALPIYQCLLSASDPQFPKYPRLPVITCTGYRSEEHTSELQSLTNLVCRLLLEKKKKNQGSKIESLNVYVNLKSRKMEVDWCNNWLYVG